MRKILFFALFLLTPIFTGAQTVSIPSVDLIWEAETYTPPDYRGRSLPTADSVVRVVAIPQFYDAQGRQVKLSDLSFHWRKDGFNIGSASGAGKNVLTYRAARTGQGNRVEVTVTALEVAVGQKATSVTARALIPVAAPQIIFYEVKDGQPDYRRALTTLAITTDRTQIIAEPFHFSLADWGNRRLAFNWSLNGQKIAPATEDPRFLTILSTVDSGGGNRTLNLNVKNAERPLQTAIAQLLISVGSSSLGF